MNQGEKITSFTDLITWQKGHALVIEVYRITNTFPNKEKFSLSDQLQRAAVSITSNIAEGFAKWSYKEKTKFYTTSLGSINEVQNQLLIARDVGYLSKKEFDSVINQSKDTKSLINGLISSTRKKI